MSSTPLVSVIMIFLNAEKFIEEAIQSVFAQTYPNWELILVDDGSSDGSVQIAKQHASRNPERVRYLQHPGGQNRGMSASRNLGFQAAHGDYIAFLDADDVYLPEKLERQAAILEKQPQAAMVYGATLHWYSWTGRAEDRQRDAPRKLGVPVDSLIQPPRLVTLFLRHLAWTPGTCGVLIRRQAIHQVGGFEERFRGMLEDQVFFYKLCLHAPVFVESGSWDRYRQHPGSAVEAALRTGEYDPRQPNPSHRAFLAWLEAYLQEHGIGDPELWQALNRKLWPYRHPYLYRLSRLLQPLALLWSAFPASGRKRSGQPAASLEAALPADRPADKPAGITAETDVSAEKFVSVCIVCRNEADKLGPCLESVAWAGEILVMDLTSTDDSASIAEAHGARVIRRAPHPIVEPLRNELAALARKDWVLALDPDERVTPGLAQELLSLSRRTDLDAILIPRMNYDLGYPPSHPIHRYEPQLRMYRRSKVTWPVVPNALPAVPEERTYRLPERDDLVILHDRNRNIPEALERAIRYAPAQAQSMLDQGQVFTAKDMLAALAQAIDKQFFLGQAWQDGVPGFLRAALLVGYKFYVWAAFWQLSGARRTPADDRLFHRLGLGMRAVRLLFRICGPVYRLARRIGGNLR